uniref:Beta-1,3-glucan-binding protein-like n=1 Tax=Saccoglossus kowalevskii TaxID=10224 RepID=A0ABM0GZQ3_SACKO|nr:PREDICTED: beta-1,3-glucan-binding protein-like [Saccoglossus kowalevskii]
MKFFLVFLIISTVINASFGFQIQNPVITLIEPQGIRFAYPDEPGISLVAYHYSINEVVNGVEPGQYNVDVTSPTNGWWLHENTEVSVGTNDIVYYWLYVLHDGTGYQLLEQQWSPSEENPTAVPGPDPGPVPTGSEPGVPEPPPPPENTAAPGEYVVTQPFISIIFPQGLRFAYPDEPGISLVSYHYNINEPLEGVNAGQYNVDVKEPTAGWWLHENYDVKLVEGDTVYYWLSVIYNNQGFDLLEQEWSPQRPTTTTPAPTTTTAAPTTTPPYTGPTTTPPTTTPYTGPTTTPPPLPTDEPGEDPCGTYPCDPGCDMDVPPCNGLIFEDDFEKLDLTKWQHEITAGGGGNWEFQLYTNNRSNSYVRDGVLYIKPTLLSETYGDDFIMTGSLDIWGAAPADICTGNQWWGCARQGYGTNIINPIQSGRLRTVNSFNFKYGRVDLEAKMPTGDWIWPAIWMLPAQNPYGQWPASGEMDIVEVRGNTQLYDSSGVSVGVDQMGSTMHWGPYWPENGYEKTHVTRFYLDDEELMHVDPGEGGFWEYGDFDKNLQDADNPWRGGTKMAPFDEEFYIIMNVAVGGVTYFDDSFTNYPHAKPWLNDSPHASYDFWMAKDQWYPTWNDEESALQVKHIQVWAYDEE